MGCRDSKPLPFLVIKERKEQNREICTKIWRPAMYTCSEKRRFMSSSGVTKQPVYKRDVFPVAAAAVGCHLLCLTRNIPASQSKHAHLHKYAVKHTLAAPGCSCGDGRENEASPASRLTSQRGCCANERAEKSKQRVGQSQEKKPAGSDRVAFLRSGRPTSTCFCRRQFRKSAYVLKHCHRK